MAEAGQAPEPGQNAGFLQKDTVLRVLLTGTTSLSHTVSTQYDEVIITHNLGFVPTFSAYWIANGGSYRYQTPTIILDMPGGTVAYSLLAYASDTQIRFGVQVPTGSSLYGSAGLTWDIKYYIFAPDAS